MYDTRGAHQPQFPQRRRIDVGPSLDIAALGVECLHDATPICSRTSRLPAPAEFMIHHPAFRAAFWLLVVTLLLCAAPWSAHSQDDPPDQPQTQPGPVGPVEPPPVVPDNVFTVVAVDEQGFVLHIDAGYNHGVITGMRFRVLHGPTDIARAEVTFVWDDKCIAQVIPGTRKQPVHERDTAILLPFVPEPRDPSVEGPPPVVPDQPHHNNGGDNGNGGTARDTNDPLGDKTAAELREILRRSNAEAFEAKREAAEAIRQRNDEMTGRMAAEAELEQARESAVVRRDQYMGLNAELQRATTLGFGASVGTTIGDPLFGGFSMGPERFSIVAGGSIDVFSLGPIDGFHAWFELVQQPGIGPRGNGQDVLRATFGFEFYLPLRPQGWNTALAIGYRHHHFPLPFSSRSGPIADGGELVFSWGRRVPMSRERELRSFWSYDFRPIIEWAHAPYSGGTGTDIRVGIGFPDLITVMVNFNWSYFTDTNRFGALHIAARIPIVQDHAELGSFRLMLTGDYIVPLDRDAYQQVFQAGIMLEINYGR